jgi:hypothetical protein
LTSANQKRSCIEEGRLQLTAAARLLQHSGLLRWHTAMECSAVDWQEFEDHWRTIDPYFGRLMCWITFSAGAEFLLKGVCLVQGVEVGHRPHSFGTLDGALKQLDRLFHTVPTIGKDEQRAVKRAYERLKKIRDRDVHAYWPNVRDGDFILVGETFVPSFNLMLSWLPDSTRMSDAELRTLLTPTAPVHLAG